MQRLGRKCIDGKNLLNGFCCLYWVGIHIFNSECHLPVLFTLQYEIMESKKFRARLDDLEFGDEVVRSHFMG